MKSTNSLDHCYSADEIAHIADALVSMAREQPKTIKRHILVNDIRVRIKLVNAETCEFHSYLACPDAQPTSGDLAAWRLACGIPTQTHCERLVSREWTDNGKIYYAQGFKWFKPVAPVNPVLPMPAYDPNQPIDNSPVRVPSGYPRNKHRKTVKDLQMLGQW